jgi:hypothetical protein
MDGVKQPSNTYLKLYAVLGALLFSVLDLGFGLRGGVLFYGASGLGLGALLGSVVDKRVAANLIGVGWTQRAIGLTGVILSIVLSGWSTYFWLWGAMDAKDVFSDFGSSLPWLTVVALNVPSLPLVSSLVSLGVAAAPIKIASRLLLVGAAALLAASTSLALAPLYSMVGLISSVLSPAPQ